jgi:hypothetical protein
VIHVVEVQVGDEVVVQSEGVEGQVRIFARPANPELGVNVPGWDSRVEQDDEPVD